MTDDKKLDEALEELEKKGLVEMKIREDGEKMYRLTQKGKMRAQYELLQEIKMGMNEND